MTVKFENFTHSFDLKGKPVFAPSTRGRQIGLDLKRRIECNVKFDAFCYHLWPGGHVAALHSHRKNSYFARVDIERFFYCIGRNRIKHCLRAAGIPRSEHYAKWSTVKNPYNDPSYALPYGFVQSPIVATLVLLESAVGKLLRDLQERITVSAYVDDISISSNDIGALERAFVELRGALVESNFSMNEEKIRRPSESMDIFNCHLSNNETRVLDTRVGEFFSRQRTPASEEAFVQYLASVEHGNSY